MSDQTQDRLYGNWMRPQAMTIRGVGWRTAIVVGAAYLSGLYVMQSSAPIGMAVLVGAVVLTVVASGRVAGLPLGTWVRLKTRWTVAHRRGRTTFRAVGVDGWRLPGPLAGTTMVRVGQGAHAYGAVHDATARRVAVTLRVASTAADLTDAGEHDAAVGRWERWLEALGRRPEVVWVNVTVETRL